MKPKHTKHVIFTGLLFSLFVLFTILVVNFDVKPIGPEQSTIGFAAINQFIFQQLGVHPIWYTITDWLGVIAILFTFGFAVVGLYQLIQRKSIRKVDAQILVLGCFYLLVIAFYLLFELVVINYRPVILGDGLEASYPSSHTIMVTCIMTTTTMQLHSYFPDKKKLCRGMYFLAVSLIMVTVVGRLISGVHWFTDILGGLLLSAALISLYSSIIDYIKKP